LISIDDYIKPEYQKWRVELEMEEKSLNNKSFMLGVDINKV